MLGAFPLSTYPIGALDTESTGAEAFTSAATALQADTVYLVELYPYQAGAASPLGIAPIAAYPIGALPDGEEPAPGIASIYLSDRGWVSTPTDTLPNQLFDGRVEQPLIVDRMLPVSPESARRIAVQVGEVVLDNDDGAYDVAAGTWAIDGRRVVVRYGNRTDAYSSFGTVFDGTGLQWLHQDGELHVSVRDNGYLLDIALQQTLYAGTGAAEGTADNTGKPKPLVFGKCRNVLLVAINPVALIYQVHARQMQSIDAVRDRGVALTAGADYADYASLAAATVGAGTYATCLALGLIRLGTKPDGQPTADVQGDAQGGYVSDAAGIVKRLLVDFGGLGAGQIDAGGFASLSAAVGGTIGVYFTDPITIADACSTIMGGIAGYWGPKRSGLITVGRLSAPASPSYRFGIGEILGAPQRLDLPASILPSNWRRTVGYQRNWTVQDKSALAAAVSATDQSFYTAQYRTVTAADVSVKTTNILSVDAPIVQGFFENLSDAALMATTLLALYTPGRMLISFVVKTVGHLLELNDTVLVTWPRYGLDAGRAMRIVGISEDCARREVTLTVWG